MSGSGWRSQAVPGTIKPVYGARYPPIESLTGNTGGGAAAAQGGQPSAKPKGPASEDSAFSNFVSRNDDAWDLADEKELVQSAADAVLRKHRAQPPVPAPSRTSAAPPSKFSKERAMQLLAIQANKERDSGGGGSKPGSSVRLGPNGAAEAAPGMYPRVPHIASSIAENSSRASEALPERQNQGSSPASLRDLQRPSSSHGGRGGEAEGSREERLAALLSEEAASVDLEALRKECWKGIPHSLRPLAWKLLLGYVPPAGAAQRAAVLERKRSEYWDYVGQYFHTRYEEHHADTFRQISIDIPRMCPLIPLFQQKRVQEVFERILYIWAIRHPACGYVQGINDLVTPFFVVFLSAEVSSETEVSTFLVSALSSERMAAVEADAFWSVSALLDSVQDNYTFAQPGIQTKIGQLEHLISRVDAPLHAHLAANTVEYLQFAFRWMNNLLMRELPLGATIRLWDTYLSESSGRAFAEFHVYVCAAFLRLWSKQLQAQKDFQSLMLLLQNLPTSQWRETEIALLTADAFSLMALFARSPHHLLPSPP